MKKLFIIIAFLVTMNASAQWVKMSNWNGSGKVITCIESDSNYLFVGTNLDGLYRSTNNGDTFSKTSLNVYYVYSLAVSGNIVFAGSESGLHISTDKGTSWSLNSFNYKTIQKIFVQGNYLYASTDSMNIFNVYFSSNNGVNWVNTNLNSQNITSFTYDGSYIYAASKYAIIKPPIFRSTLGNTSWTLVAYVDSLSPDSRQAVGDFASIGNYVFAGMNNFQMYTRSIYRSTDNGIHWLPTSLDEGDVFTLTTFGNNLVAGMYGRGVFLSTNYGVNWISKNQGIGNYEYISYSCKSNTNIFVGGIYFIWRRTLAEIAGVNSIITEIPAKYSLSQNYPNPFNPSTVIRCQLPVVSFVSLKVYDVMGREVQTLVNERLQPGTYEATFDGSMLNSGVFFYKFVTDGFTETKRMLMVK